MKRNSSGPVSVVPPSLNFGNQAINSTSKSQNVTITNNQTVALTILDLAFNLSDYTDTTTCPISPRTLAAGASCTVSIFFTRESPVFSGGVRVLNWTNTSGSTWRTTLPVWTQNFEALYYNGVRRQRPRLGSTTAKPLGTYYRIAGIVAGDYDRFYYNASDPISSAGKNYAPAIGNPCGQKPGPANLQGDIQIAIFEQWDVSWERISCIDITNHLIYLTGSTDTGAPHGYILNHRYLVENVKDSLTVPGQWFLDRSVTGAWVLTYIADPGENPNLDTVFIPQQPQLLTGASLQRRTFYGITFANENLL